MRYKVRVKINNDPNNIIVVPFHWRKLSKKYKSFIPTKQAQLILGQFNEWINLDCDKSPDQLPVYK